MTSTLGFTGMDRSTQSELREAIGQSIKRLGLELRLVEDDNAEAVVVDMDSLYGPMSWMQLHNAGRQVIGYTASARSQTDFRLPRPFDAAAIDALLQSLGAKPVAMPATAIAPRETPQPQAPLKPATPHGPASAPIPADVLPEEMLPVMADEERAAPASDPAPQIVATSISTPQPMRDATLTEWLQSGRLQGRVRLHREGSPVLLIDSGAGEYHGPVTLKPLESYFNTPLNSADFIPVDEARWQHASTEVGALQPLSRLTWFANLLQGRGELLPHVDANGRYRLSKWLQTEREFPKHFRIATAMMKAPATLADIAIAANVSHGEVADFINAGLATGIVQQDTPEPPASEPSRGIFGIKRNR